MTIHSFLLSDSMRYLERHGLDSEMSTALRGFLEELARVNAVATTCPDAHREALDILQDAMTTATRVLIEATEGSYDVRTASW